MLYCFYFKNHQSNDNLSYDSTLKYFYVNNDIFEVILFNLKEFIKQSTPIIPHSSMYIVYSIFEVRFLSHINITFLL